MLLIKNAVAADGSGLCSAQDILIRDGRIAKMGPDINAPDAKTLDASGLVAAPGLVDMHVHLREPGYEYKEDIESGSRAAARGGVTTMLCMPNTRPVIDTPELVRFVSERGRQAGLCRVLPIAAVTVGEKGAERCDYAALSAAGAAAFSDDGVPVMSAAVMRQALIECRELDRLIIAHSEDGELVRDYAVNEGELSRRLGIPGRPAVAEEYMVARDIMLAESVGGRVHIAHISTAKSVELVRRAKAQGVAVSCETCPQYFCFNESRVLEAGTSAKMNPPLRTEADRLAMIDGLCDGTIDAIATDHAPHSKDEKARPLTEAPSGVSGLETSLAAALTALYHTGRMTLPRLMALMSLNPARLLGLRTGLLREGAAADIVLFDPEERWTVEPERFASKGRATPFAGMELRGRVRQTILGGKLLL